MIRPLAKFGMLSVLMISFLGCKDDEEDKKTGKVTLNLTSDTSAAGLALTPPSGEFRDLPIATGTGDGLQSLKMYFRSIEICRSIEDSGSGYSNTTGCVSIYSNLVDTYNGITGPTAAERSTFMQTSSGKFYDVLSATDLALLNTGVAVDVGEYNYGIVETHPWVKFKAKSGTLCTKSAGAKEESATGGDGVVTYSTIVDSLDCDGGEPEEVLSYITNANTHFKFLTPFTVAEDDSVVLDLAFNLANEVRALEGSLGGNLKAADADNSFYVPMIRMTPAPRLATQTTKVETYIMGSPSQKDQIRVQLYYNSADADKGILGINAAVLSTVTSAESKSNKAVYVSTLEQSGTTLTLKAWDGRVVATFTRGVAGTLTYTCESAPPFMLEECGSTATVSYEYDAPTVGEL